QRGQRGEERRRGGDAVPDLRKDVQSVARRLAALQHGGEEGLVGGVDGWDDRGEGVTARREAPAFEDFQTGTERPAHGNGRHGALASSGKRLPCRVAFHRRKVYVPQTIGTGGRLAGRDGPNGRNPQKPSSRRFIRTG